LAEGIGLLVHQATLEELLSAPSVPEPKERYFHAGQEYVFKEPFDPSIELTKDGIIESGVYVRRVAPTALPKVLRAAELESEPEPTAVLENNEQFPLQPEQESEVLESTGYEEPKNPVCYGNSEETASEPIAIPPAVRTPKRPVGRPPVWSSEAERIADYRRRKKMETAETSKADTVSDIPVPPEVVSTRPKKPRNKWQSDVKREPTEPHEPLVLPALPEGAYRARDVVSAKRSVSNSTSRARRNYHAILQDNRCFFCERAFGTYVQKNAAKPEPLRVEDEHFIPRRLPGSRKDDNRHAVCHICNKLKSDLVFNTEEQCRMWLAEAWQLNGYHEVDIQAVRYLARDGSVLFEDCLAPHVEAIAA